MSRSSPGALLQAAEDGVAVVVAGVPERAGVAVYRRCLRVARVLVAARRAAERVEAVALTGLSRRPRPRPTATTRRGRGRRRGRRERCGLRLNDQAATPTAARTSTITTLMTARAAAERLRGAACGRRRSWSAAPSLADTCPAGTGWADSVRLVVRSAVSVRPGGVGAGAGTGSGTGGAALVRASANIGRGAERRAVAARPLEQRPAGHVVDAGRHARGHLARRARTPVVLRRGREQPGRGPADPGGRASSRSARRKAAGRGPACR